MAWLEPAQLRVKLRKATGSRKKALIRRFGSLKRIRAASKTDLGEVLPDRVVETLWETLHG